MAKPSGVGMIDLRPVRPSGDPDGSLPAMREPRETHEQLISLSQLCLDGRKLAFRQGFLSVTAGDGAPSWSCTLRGVAAKALGLLKGELLLRGRARDGRTVEGQVLAPDSSPSCAGMTTVVQLAGLGPLLIEGREL